MNHIFLFFGGADEGENSEAGNFKVYLGHYDDASWILLCVCGIFYKSINFILVCLL